jgi:hypothetical protein
MWTNVGTGTAEECPPYWMLRGVRYETLDEAISAQSCSSECVRHLGSAVMFLMCGHRDEYVTWETEGCSTLLEFSTGFYESLESYQDANPCP